MNVYEIVTEKIIKKLEAGVIPWRIPWTQASAVNWKNEKPYRGINAMLLDPGEYATFLQIKEAGGTVKKGEKSHLIVFWKLLERENEKTGKFEDIPCLRYYKVFEINTQCEGLTSKRKAEAFDNEPIAEAQKIIEGYKDCPPVTFAPGRAFYRPSTDNIRTPAITDYHKTEEYYSVFFHEMIHSTGHKSRLNRSGIDNLAAFGSESYSKEELIAEIGASMLCGVAGIDNHTLDNSAAYIKSWLRKLKDDNKLIVQAAGAAQKAADYIRNISANEE